MIRKECWLDPSAFEWALRKIWPFLLYFLFKFKKPRTICKRRKCFLFILIIHPIFLKILCTEWFLSCICMCLGWVKCLFHARNRPGICQARLYWFFIYFYFLFNLGLIRAPTVESIPFASAIFYTSHIQFMQEIMEKVTRTVKYIIL